MDKGVDMFDKFMDELREVRKTKDLNFTPLGIFLAGVRMARGETAQDILADWK